VHIRQGVHRLGSGVGHRPGLELALQQIGTRRLSGPAAALVRKYQKWLKRGVLVTGLPVDGADQLRPVHDFP